VHSPANPTDAVNKFLLGSMALSVCLAVTSIATLGPLLVDMSVALTTSVPLMAQLVTAAATTWALSALLAGPFSGAYGRRPVLVLGLCLLATGSLGLGTASSLGTAAAFCMLIGMGGGMVPPTCVSVVGDTVPEGKKGDVHCHPDHAAGSKQRSWNTIGRTGGLCHQLADILLGLEFGAVRNCPSIVHAGAPQPRTTNPPQPSGPANAGGVVARHLVHGDDHYHVTRDLGRSRCVFPGVSDCDL
jgi:hypothetical protein